MRFCNGHHARAMLCLHGQVVQHHALRPMHPQTAAPCEVATVSPRTLALQRALGRCVAQCLPTILCCLVAFSQCPKGE